MIKDFPHALNAMFGVIALLTGASFITSSLIKKYPLKDYTELRLRVQSWWWIIAAVFIVLALGKVPTLIFFAMLSFLALKEFLSITPVRQADRGVIFLLYMAIPIQYYWVATQWYGMSIIFIPVFVFLFVPILMIFTGKDSEGFVSSAGLMNLALMLTVFCVSHMGLLLFLDAQNAFAGSAGLILFLLFMTQFNDVSQYAWGKTLGSRKIAPRISPNKTWEGFLGGVLSLVIISVFAGPYLTSMSIKESCIAALLIACGGFLGDLVVSSIKRDLHLKDTGKMIPGHGGLLDRIDSLIYASPLFFHYINYVR